MSKSLKRVSAALAGEIPFVKLADANKALPFQARWTLENEAPPQQFAPSCQKHG